MLLGGGRGSKTTYSSLLYATKGRHSISVVSFCLDELRLGRLHPNQIKRVREFVRIVLLFSLFVPLQKQQLIFYVSGRVKVRFCRPLDHKQHRLPWQPPG